jgi:hypothetical protein
MPWSCKKWWGQINATSFGGLLMRKNLLVLVVGLLLLAPATAKADKIHGLTQENEVAEVLVHVDTPIWTNTAGISLKAAIIDAGEYGTTVLSSDFITTTESNQIASCDVIEFSRRVNVPPAVTANDIKDDADRIIADYQQWLKNRYKYYMKALDW